MGNAFEESLHAGERSLWEFRVKELSDGMAFFIPDCFRSNPPEVLHDIHQAFCVLGALTVLSTIVFRELKSEDAA